MKTLKRTWADVSLDALAHNYHKIKEHLPAGTRFMGVMKADAYGHGAVPVSHALCELGAEYLAVSNLDEAVQLRRGGVHAPILILGYTPADHAGYLVSMGITQEVHSLEYARELNEALKGTKFTLRIHLKLDTGMTRIGFFGYDCESTLPQLLQVSRLERLYVEGVFTHFCAADSREDSEAAFTRLQYERFCGMLDALAASGVRPELRHCANSGATLLYPEFAMDMVRPGIATYGLAPAADCQGIVDLRPMMSLRTTVSQLRDVPAGASISYGRMFRAERPFRMAVLPIGYADGLLRALSGRLCFYLNGKPVPQVGRICMDMCMVDVSSVPEAKVGDELTIFGYDEGGALHPCEELSDALGTISYEILCGINKRVPRIYWQNGKASEILQYIV